MVAKERLSQDITLNACEYTRHSTCHYDTLQRVVAVVIDVTRRALPLCWFAVGAAASHCCYGVISTEHTATAPRRHHAAIRAENSIRRRRRATLSRVVVSHGQPPPARQRRHRRLPLLHARHVVVGTRLRHCR